MDIEGVVFKVLPVQSGKSARGEWQKREVVFDLQDNVKNRKVCVAFFGDRAADVENLKEGDKAKVSIDIESREYNGRWYTNVNAWRIQTLDATATPAESKPIQKKSAEEAPFGEAPQVSSEPVDDLPF